jgi:hypothetical protein
MIKFRKIMEHIESICIYLFIEEKKHFEAEVDEEKLFVKYNCGIRSKEYYEAIIQTQKKNLWYETNCPFTENKGHIFVNVLMVMKYLGIEVEGVKL